MKEPHVCPCCPAEDDYVGDLPYFLCPTHFAIYPYPLRLALCESNTPDALTKWAIVAGAAEPIIFHHAFSDVDDWIELHNIATDAVRFVRVSSILRCGIKTQ